MSILRILKSLSGVYVLAAALFMAAMAAPVFASGKVEAVFFQSPHCKVCLSVKKEFLPQIFRKYGDRLDWKELNIDDNAENIGRLYAAARQHGKDPFYPAVLINGQLLVGRNEIVSGLEPAINSASAGAVNAVGETGSDITEIFNAMSVTAVIGGGLIDGINPCAFAVIVFFVSFLAVYGYSRKEIVAVGLAYCAAVFVAYLLIGLGLFKALYALSGFYSVMKGFYYVMIACCFVLFGLSLYDYLSYRKTGSGDGMVLQLPKSFKRYINRIMGLLRGKSEQGIFRLTLAAFGVGFLVSFIEAVCTGQVYIPTIAFIMKNSDMKARAFTYLVLYNIMFIVPLLGVFGLSLAGYNSAHFNGMLKRNLGAAKILLSLVFLGLGLLLLFTM